MADLAGYSDYRFAKNWRHENKKAPNQRWLGALE